MVQSRFILMQCTNPVAPFIPDEDGEGVQEQSLSNMAR